MVTANTLQYLCGHHHLNCVCVCVTSKWEAIREKLCTYEHMTICSLVVSPHIVIAIASGAVDINPFTLHTCVCGRRKSVTLLASLRHTSLRVPYKNSHTQTRARLCTYTETHVALCMLYPILSYPILSILYLTD